ncbi:MAG: hypothetical protein GEU79_07340 [Acidimicrobiia bacterium]|nr:hypothetical protein [Acidimicrobiia bacterium]
MSDDGTIRCVWCGSRFVPSPGPGRPQRYCRRSHRQRAYEARQVASDHGLGEDDVLLSKATFISLRDGLFRLEAASDDVATDRSEGVDPDTIIDGLTTVINDVVSIDWEPKAVGEG